MPGMSVKERLDLWLEKIRNETESAENTAIEAIKLLRGAGIAVDDDAVNGSAEDPIPDEAAVASLVVGKAAGKPGETVTIEILGGAEIPVQGFAIAIGIDPILRVVSREEAPELEQLLGIDDPEDVFKQHRGRTRHWQDNWLQLYVGFYSQVFGVVEIEEGKPPPKVKRTIVEKSIPPMTPLYLLKVKIPEDVPPGTRFELDCEHRYGRKLNSNGPVKFLEWPPRFGTSAQVAQYGIKKKDIQLVSGWIEVLEP